MRARPPRRELKWRDDCLEIRRRKMPVDMTFMEKIMAKSTRIVTLMAMLFLSPAAMAATGDFTKIDTNGDGKITLDEGVIMHPEWTAAAFKSLDTNADGSLNELEYEAAVTVAPTTNN